MSPPTGNLAIALQVPNDIAVQLYLGWVVVMGMFYIRDHVRADEPKPLHTMKPPPVRSCVRGGGGVDSAKTP